VGPDSIKALRALIEQGGLDLDPDRDLRENPVTLDEMLNTIDVRIRRRLENTDHPIYRSLAEQIERLRARAIRRAEDSIECLKQALELRQAHEVGRGDAMTAWLMSAHRR
jgi:type I restriction enzyme, R subunit